MVGFVHHSIYLKLILKKNPPLICTVKASFLSLGSVWGQVGLFVVKKTSELKGSVIDAVEPEPTQRRAVFWGDL